MKELREELKEWPELAGAKDKKILKQNAKSKNIHLKKTVQEKVEGYVGKAKGLKQIAWERGFWTRAQLQVRGGIKDEVIRAKIQECSDFANEVLQLQHIASKLSLAVVMTPKAHLELAGQGIEYSWGYSKFTFRRKNVGGDKAKNLEANIKQAISTNRGDGLNLE